MSIRLAIVGAGTIGQVHAVAANGAGASIARVVDVHPERAARLASQFPGATHSGDVAALWEDSSIDAVVIAVPNRWHMEYAIAAMKAGKDVLLEKPMGLNATECQAINDIAESKRRILQIGMVHRWTGVGQAAKAALANGKLGAVYHAKANLYRRRSVPGLGGWFTTRSVSGGGVLVDNGVHLIDLALWLMDFPPVTRVSGRIYAYFGRRMKDYVYESMWAGPPQLDGVCDVEDSAHALIHLEGGATLDLQVAWAMNIPTRLESSMMGFFGERGGVTFQLFGDHLEVATEQERRNVDRRAEVPAVDQFQQQMLAFVRCVQTRELPMATGRQGQIVQSIIDAIYESSQTDREVLLAG